MTKHKIEWREKCKSCKGTALYVGLAERDGAAVICHTCKGKGYCDQSIVYEDFEGIEKKEGVERVFQNNPGIIIGKGETLSLADFGGMPFSDWEKASPFLQNPKTENSPVQPGGINAQIMIKNQGGMNALESVHSQTAHISIINPHVG